MTTQVIGKFPCPTSVKGRFLADLLRGDQVTHMDVWRRHGSSRAAHHVLRLRQAGFPILTREIEAPTSDGRIALIAEYSLPNEAIAAAGELGRQFVATVAQFHREHGLDETLPATICQHGVGSAWAAYELAKSAWDQANPDATYEARDVAMRKLAEVFRV